MSIICWVFIVLKVMYIYPVPFLLVFFSVLSVQLSLLFVTTTFYVYSLFLFLLGLIFFHTVIKMRMVIFSFLMSRIPLSKTTVLHRAFLPPFIRRPLVLFCSIQLYLSVTWLKQFILHNFITWIIFGREWNLWSFSFSILFFPLVLKCITQGTIFEYISKILCWSGNAITCFLITQNNEWNYRVSLGPLARDSPCIFLYKYFN